MKLPVLRSKTCSYRQQNPSSQDVCRKRQDRLSRSSVQGHGSGGRPVQRCPALWLQRYFVKGLFIGWNVLSDPAFHFLGFLLGNCCYAPFPQARFEKACLFSVKIQINYKISRLDTCMSTWASAWSPSHDAPCSVLNCDWSEGVGSDRFVRWSVLSL